MHVVIIGNGITGVTAALRVRKLHGDWRLTLVSGESPLFYSRPALMYVYMGQMSLEDTMPHPRRVFDDNRIERVQAWVRGVDVKAQRLELEGAPPLPYDQLLIATGSKPNKLGWPGQDLPGVQGFYDLQDLALLERSTPGVRRAVVVGGGLIGVELAEMLHSRGIAVTFLARETAYWNNALPDEEARLVGDTVRAHGIDLRLSTELAAIEAGASGRAAAVVTSSGERIECQLVGLTVGVSPNVAALGGSGIALGRGVRVDDTLRTATPNVFAAGDCAEIGAPEEGRGRVEQLWYTGKRQGEVVGDVIAGKERRYDRGVWFNSAKFFDLEWHTYGRVAPDVARGPRERHAVWRHESERALLRVAHEDGAVIGMNAFGLRQRHAVWEKWIAERRPLSYVTKHLREAHFDPELSRRYEPAIARTFAGSAS